MKLGDINKWMSKWQTVVLLFGKSPLISTCIEDYLHSNDKISAQDSSSCFESIVST